MRIAVLGAGAIGAYVGAHLARGGAETHLIARGANLEAMQRSGVRIAGGAEDVIVEIPATDDPREIGPVDFVFLGLKAHSYAGCGGLLEPLLGPDTAVVAAQNGIPWWYFHAHGGPYDGRRIESVDPGGAVSAVIAPERAIGCVVYASTELAEPGVVRHIEGNRFSIGEPDGSESDRCRAFGAAMDAGGLKAPIDRKLRDQIWLKLMGNAAFNPLSALTRSTMAEICRDPGTRAVAAAIMEETLAVARAVGSSPSISVERRMAGAERVGDHKTSMLQDVETGKRLELDALVGAVVELADLGGIQVPNLRAIGSATALLAERLDIR